MAIQTVVVQITIPPPTPVVVNRYEALPGADGAGAYQSYLETTTDDPVLTEAEWSASRAAAALALAGGTMDEGAAIAFANGTRIITGRMAAAPTAADDITKGFIVGSLVETDSLVIYECSDNTEGAAVWFLRGKVLVEVVVPTVATDYEIPLPGNGTYYGQKVIYHIISSSGGNLTLGTGILTIGTSLIVFPFAVAAGDLWIAQLMWTPKGWVFVTLLGPA